VHVACSLVSPQNFDWETTRAADHDGGELRRGRRPRRRRRRRRAGRGTAGAREAVDRQVGPSGHGCDRCALAGGEVQLAPATSPCGRRYGVAIAWGTVGSAVIIVLPLVGSWGTICKVCAGMFTSDGVYERLDEVNLRLKAIMVAMPEAEKRYQQMQQDQQNAPWRRRTWPPPPMAQTKMMILQLQR
jgi:urea-proton symporter